MKCLSCKINFNFLFKTSNCVEKDDYPSYYLNITDQILYPCSNFKSNCYECEHLGENRGKCLSCEKGYSYNNDTNECQKCNQNEFPVIITNFLIAKKVKLENVIYMLQIVYLRKITKLFVLKKLQFLIE